MTTAPYYCRVCSRQYSSPQAFAGHKAFCGKAVMPEDERAVPPKAEPVDPCTCYEGAGVCGRHEGDAW